MTLALNYPDTATFVEAQSDNGYSNKKVKYQQFDCPVIFVQSIDFAHSNFQDAIDADAVCYPDINNSDVIAYANRLEGLYILMPLYGAADDQAWFKVIRAAVHRDHLLGNIIDNIELQLKKSEPIPGVS